MRSCREQRMRTLASCRLPCVTARREVSWYQMKRNILTAEWRAKPCRSSALVMTKCIRSGRRQREDAMKTSTKETTSRWKMRDGVWNVCVLDTFSRDAGWMRRMADWSACIVAAAFTIIRRARWLSRVSVAISVVQWIMAACDADWMQSWWAMLPVRYGIVCWELMRGFFLTSTSLRKNTRPPWRAALSSSIWVERNGWASWWECCVFSEWTRATTRLRS